MSEFFNQLKSVWDRLEVPQRATLLFIVVAFVAVLGMIGYGATRPDWRVLASGLDAASTAEIAAYLDGQGVEYRIADNERTVMVPSANLYTLRNNLAEQELLGDGSTGFELLERSGMGDSSFKEQKNYDRAIAGELERSFREIPGVASARVIVNRPPPSPFLADERQASASVKLHMQAGRRLSERQLAGIIHLTAGASEGLMPDRVQVMDNTGLLTRPDDDPAAIAANSSLEAERAKEQHLTRKAQDLLDRALGPGRSMVSVAVDMDFTKRTQASSKPTESVILRQSSTASDESTPVPAGGGLAGTASNVEGETAGGSGSDLATKVNEEDTREFVVGKETKTVEEEIGSISGMTVSILLDVKSRTTEAAEEEGAEAIEKIELYTQAEQETFATLVLDAIGYRAALGAQKAIDTTGTVESRFNYSVQSVAFQQPEPVEPMQAGLVPGVSNEELLDYGRYAVAGVVALMLLLIARGQLKKSQAALETERERQQVERENKKKIREDAAAAALNSDEAQQTLRDKVQADVNDDPAHAADVIKGWLSG